MFFNASLSSSSPQCAAMKMWYKMAPVTPPTRGAKSGIQKK